MSDIVTRLRNWRTVHLARLHLLMDEAADEMAILRSDNNRRADLEAGLREAIVRLSANVDCSGQDNAARQDNTPATHATPSESSVQSECTLTDSERAAIERAMKDENELGMVYTADVLKWLLERTK